MSSLEQQGHRRLLVLTGEHPKYTFDQFLHAIDIISSVQTEPCGNIRRINVEIPTLSVSDMRRLKATDKVREKYHIGHDEKCGCVEMCRVCGRRIDDPHGGLRHIPDKRRNAAGWYFSKRDGNRNGNQLPVPLLKSIIPYHYPWLQVGTFTLFQETYHRETFAKMHVSGPKSDYDHRLLSQVGGGAEFKPGS